MKDLEFIQELDKLLTKLAEILNVSVETVQANASEYLVEFAKFQFVNNIGAGMLLAPIIGFCGAAATTFVLFLFEEGSSKEVISDGVFVRFIVGSFLIFSMIGFILFSDLLPFLVSPEIYGATELLKIIK